MSHLKQHQPLYEYDFCWSLNTEHTFPIMKVPCCHQTRKLYGGNLCLPVSEVCLFSLSSLGVRIQKSYSESLDIIEKHEKTVWIRHFLVWEVTNIYGVPHVYKHWVFCLCLKLLFPGFAEYLGHWFVFLIFLLFLAYI